MVYCATWRTVYSIITYDIDNNDPINVAQSVSIGHIVVYLTLRMVNSIHNNTNYIKQLVLSCTNATQ